MIVKLPIMTAWTGRTTFWWLLSLELAASAAVIALALAVY